MTRKFTSKPATREAVPLLIGLAGPSGSGKTYSALRLAGGIQSVTGGEIFVIDTEARRALHYADQFDFQHLAFEPPFSPLDYLGAIEHCVKKGAGIIVVDSMSHEHEGKGGVLEMHDAKAKELAAKWKTTLDKVKITAWSEPKAQRRRLLNDMVHTGASLICCFRAKEKLKIVTGKQPEPLGWMPIGGEEFVYEMTTSILLPAGSGGVPRWNPSKEGERAMTKLPRQFEWLTKEKGPLSEAMGARMATWARGLTERDEALLVKVRGAGSPDALEALVEELKSADSVDTLRAAYAARKHELEARKAG